jgi:hypothetical protein
LLLVAPASAQFEPNNVITVNLLSNITGSNWTGTNALWAKGRASVNDGLGGLYVRLSAPCVVNATTCVQDTSGAYWQFSGGFSGTTGFAAAGSSTNVQYNSGGALGANSSFTTDGAGNTYSALHINVGAGAAGCTIGQININGCLTNSVNPVVNVAGTLVGIAANNYHAYSDSRDVNLATGTAANSYDCRGTGSGSNNIDHFACFQSSWSYNGTGTMTDYFGLYSTGTITNAGGTITNGYAVYANPPSPGFGTLLNSYGVYISDSAGSTKQYSLYSAGTNDTSYFAGYVGIGVEPIANQQFALRETTVAGTWQAGFWLQAANYATMRMWSTTSDLWAGLGTDAGTLYFLVNASTTTGTPVSAGYFGTTGGLVLGLATGGDKGLGTLNVAADIYKNNTAYTNPDYVFEHRFKGKIVKFAKNEGAADYKGLAPLPEVEKFIKKELVLPSFARARARAARNGKPVGLFNGGDALLEAQEEAYLYLISHDKVLRKLSMDNAALKSQLSSQAARLARLEKLMGGGR